MTASKKYKIIFLATSDIAIQLFEELLQTKNIEVQALVTQPDSFVGRKHTNLVINPIKQIALKHNLLVLQPHKIVSISEQIDKLKPDALITCAYGQYLPQRILEAAPFRLNFHASLLPKYRGASPLQYCIANQEHTTGVSLMTMNKGLDQGPVFYQKKLAVSVDETYKSLFLKFQKMLSTLIPVLFLVFANKLQAIPQDDSQASYAPIITRQEEHLNWNQPATHVVAWIRALYDKPIAFSFLRKKIVFKIYEAYVVTASLADLNLKQALSGQVLLVNKKGIYVQANPGIVLLTKVKWEGQKITLASTLKGRITTNDYFS